ncbi:MAG: GNAT family N-acetyltransferase [Bacteroidota bacterium]
MQTFPTLYTPRLLLRKIGPDDIPALLKYANNPKIAERIANIPYPYPEPTAVFRISYVVQGFKKGIRYVFAIIEQEREELIGEISLNLSKDRKQAALGYWIGEPFWGQGIGTEALARVLKFGFTQLELQAVFANTHQDNRASQRVLEKNGMEDRGLKGKNKEYGLTNSAYAAMIK